MAKQPSAHDIIAKNVNTTIANNISKPKENPAVAELKKLQKDDYSGYTSRVAKSITSVYRASQENSQHRAQENEIRDYHAMASIIAEKRGITPAGKNGQFSEEQYAKDLSPVNLLKELTHASLDRAYSSSASKEENEENFNLSRSVIEGGIESSYEENQPDEHAAALLDTVKHMSYMSDEEFLELEDENDRAAYLQQLSDAERDRLTKYYEENHQKPFDPTRNASQFRGFEDDTDWGYKKDDDNFKIEQGDIIDYLMKEVILSSAAWAGNKVAGLGGIILYEGLTYTGRKLSPFVQSKKQALFRGYDNIKERLFGDSNDPETQNRSALFDEFLGENGSLLNAQAEALAQYNAFFDDKKASEFSHYTTQKRIDMALGKCTPTENGFLYNENNQIKGCRYPNNQPLEGYFKKLQEDIEKALLAEMKEKINPNDDNDESPKNKEIKNWLEAQRKAEKDELEGKTPTYPDNPEMKAAYEIAKSNTVTEINALAAHREILAMEKHFEATYTAYKITELFRTDPKNALFKDEEDKTAKQKMSEAIDMYALEGRAIFLHNLQNMREGKPAVSSKELILQAQDALTKEQNDKDSQKHSNPFQNSIEETKEEPKRKELRDAFDNLTLEETLTQRLTDINKEEAYLQSRADCNNEKRNQIEILKKRYTDAEQRAQNATNKGISINTAKTNANQR